MNRTPIEWVKNPDGTQGYTFNPITGCLNGCEYCYARKLANTRLKERYLAHHDYKQQLEVQHIQYVGHPDQDPFYPRLWEDRLLQVQKAPKNSGIFVCDMSDMFGIGIPEKWIERVMEQIKIFSQHRFYLLTKQPQELPKWSPFPSNVWLGVSVTNQQMFDKAVHYLKMVDAKVKFLSFEPLLDHIIVEKNWK